MILFALIFSTLTQAEDVDDILQQYLTKDYIVVGPKKIVIEGDYLKYYLYPKTRKIYIPDVEFIKDIDITNTKVFKGYIIKDKFTGKILILPMGDYHEPKEK